jgi:GT2 family glycosyltransferase
MSQPLVHVIIINWNGMDHLQACYDSLLANPYENVRYVLLDNCSDDESVSYVRENYGSDRRVEIVECETNLGWSGGNNIGMERAIEANADYIMLLNNDTAVAPDIIEKLVEAAEADEQIGALAPKMLLFDEPDVLNSVGLICSVIGACWDLGLGRLDGPQWNEPQKVIGACGGAAFFRTEALRKSGLLPPDYGIYLDDLELCLRIWSAGYEVWSCPSASVRHKFSATMGSGARLRQKYFLNVRNRGRLILRNFPMRKIVRHFPTMLWGEVRAVGRALLSGELWKVLVHVRAWVSTLAYVGRGRAAYADHHVRIGTTGNFWPHIINRPLFFPGAELPHDGWYAPRTIENHAVKPMAARAHYKTEGGSLRLTHVNCYPHLGATKIQVALNGQAITTLSTSGVAETKLDVEGGTLTFQADHIFDAQQTGETIDLGGWIGIDPAP